MTGFTSRRSVLAGIGATGLVATAARAQQGYPNRPVRMISGFNPGTPPDVIGRLLAPRLSESLGQQFVVESKPGAGERIAGKLVASAPPDGHTLWLMTGAQTVVAATDPAVSYDLLKDFTLISILTHYPFTLVTGPNSPYRTYAEVLEAARRNPGKITYASAGFATTTHLGMELVCRQAGVKMTHVPYEGGSRTANDVIAGHVDLWYSTLSISMGMIQGGQIRLLAFTSKERDPRFPDIPSVAELAPGSDVVTWLGVTAAAGVPRPVVDRIVTGMREAMDDASVNERMTAFGMTSQPSTPEAFRARAEADIAKWRPFADLVKAG